MAHNIHFPGILHKKTAAHVQASATSEAGGGASSAMDPGNADIANFEPTILTALSSFYQSTKSNAVGLPKEQADELATGDLSTFLDYMRSSKSSALLLPPACDLDMPLSSYFISSSHNTYLTGHQLYGTSTADGYKNVSFSCRIY